MSRRVVFPPVLKGMVDSFPAEGSAWFLYNLRPWRGMLRRRGPKRLVETIGAVEPNSCFGSDPEIGMIGRRTSDSKLVVRAHGDSVWTLIDNAPSPKGLGRWTRIGDELVFCAATFPGITSTRGLIRWAGSKQAAEYTTGTISYTEGTRTITGSGTSWTSTMKNAYIAITCTDTSKNRVYRITAVNSGTSITVDAPLLGTPSSYNIRAFAVYGYYAYSPTATTPNPIALEFHDQRVFAANFTDSRNGYFPEETSLVRYSNTPKDAEANGSAWYSTYGANAYFRVDSRYGPIVGLASWNRNLVILKPNAVMVASGAFASDGTDLGAAVATVAVGPGAQCATAWDRGPAGVFFANADGLYRFDGEGVQNLTKGVIDGAWAWGMSDPAANPRFTVSYVGDRVIVQSSKNPSHALVFDLLTQSFWYQVNGVALNAYSPIVETRDGNGKLWAEGQCSENGAYVGVVNWRNDFTPATGHDLPEWLLSTSEPQAVLYTHSASVGDGLSSARVEEIIAQYRVDDDTVDDDLLGLQVRAIGDGSFAHDSLITQPSQTGQTYLPASQGAMIVGSARMNPASTTALGGGDQGHSSPSWFLYLTDQGRHKDTIIGAVGMQVSEDRLVTISGV